MISFRLFLLLLCLVSKLLFAYTIQEPSPGKLKALYNSLDPSSIAQHVAFYELYWNSKEGQQALQDAYGLLTGNQGYASNSISLPPSLSNTIHAMIGLVNKSSNTNWLMLSQAELNMIENWASRLPNRQLAGYQATSEDQVLKLPAEQIDLARGLLLSQLEADENSMQKIRNYEAGLDLMALQILARITLNSSPQEKIHAINHFIFEELGFRFPPHSTHAKDIDLYTFLPSVLDSRRGVCLGVSILYICLAQRLNLALEIVIPPGHIFVRWHDGDELINIETTARGINIPNDDYLGVDLRSLPQCNIKETIGMAHFNQASVYWDREMPDKAMAAYIKAKPYLPEYKLLTGLMGYTAILQGDEDKGKKLLTEVVDYLPEHAVSKDTIAEDYLNGKINKDGIKAFFKHVDETRESLLEKKEALENVLTKYPQFREGHFSLAGTWLQLHRSGEALEALEKYHKLDKTNPSVEYYLAVLYSERMDYNSAWVHLRQAEKIVKARDHHPEALLNLRQELGKLCPE